VEQKIKSIMAEVLEMSADQIGESTAMDNTDSWDSLKHMEMVMALEESFQVELPADEMMEMISFNDIKRILRDKGVQC